MILITNHVLKSILSPEMTIRNAWARTSILSGNPALQKNETNTAINQIKTILDNAQTFEETRYVNEVSSAIESTFRSLASARNHFSLNLEELKERRDKSIADLEHTTTVSSDFQSLITRISAITFGSAGGLTVWGFLVNYFQAILPNVPNIDTVVLPLFLVTFAAIGYLIHNLYYIPRKAEKIKKQLIKTDYYRIIYYKFYVERCRKALANLHETTNSLYKTIFNLGNYPNSKTTKNAVDEVLKGMEIDDLMCGYIHDHVLEKKLEMEDIWVMCETGINKEKCSEEMRERAKF